MAEAKELSLLNCTICLEAYVNPKILPCFHTFCCECLQKCLEKVSKNGYFNCPSCRAKIKIPQKGAKDFQTNFYLNETIQRRKQEPTRDARVDISASKTGYCEYHSGEKIRFFCDVCQVTCCCDCKIDHHDGHPSVKLGELVNRLLPEAEELLALVNVKSEKLESLEVNLQEKLEFVEKEKAKITDQIKHRHSVAKEKIDEYAKEALSDLTQVTQAAADSIRQTIESTKTSRDKVAAISKSLTATVSSKNPVDLLQKIPEYRDSFDILPQFRNACELFAGITISGPADRNIIGKVIVKRYPCELRDNLELIASAGTKLKDNNHMFIKSLLPVSENETWVAVRSRKESDKNTLMKKIRGNGQEILSVAIPGRVNSIVLLPDKSIAVSMPFDDKICVIENGVNMYELASVRRPFSMAVRGEELFVCSVESNDLRKVQPHSVNRIFVLSLRGQIKRTLEFYDGKAIFTSPGKISSTYDGELLVIDLVKKKIVSIDACGKQKNEYCDDSKVFREISCDESGHILVETSDGILVLSGEFKPICVYNIATPLSEVSAFAVGPGGKIWIGSDKAIVSIWKYTK